MVIKVKKHLKIVNKLDYNSKNKNRKIDFSLDLAHCVSSSKTEGEGGFHILSWEKPNCFQKPKHFLIHMLQTNLNIFQKKKYHN